MGQQQLLLIVLGVIIVGIAVVVGINVFTASSVEANKNAVIADLTTIASMAQQYYRKPVAMGGGGRTFNGGSAAWDVPGQLASTANGQYVATTVAAQSVTLTGTGTELGANGSEIVITMIVDPDSIRSTTFTNP